MGAFFVMAAISILPSTAQSKATPPNATPQDAQRPDPISADLAGAAVRNVEDVGGRPFTPAGEAAYKYNMTQSINPEGLCLFQGVPRASVSGVPFEILFRTAWLSCTS